MIYDNISNISTYKGLFADIYEGLKYLQQLNPDIAVGTYQINPRVKAIVSEYETKRENECGYEAHRKNIDIQFTVERPICGICLLAILIKLRKNKSAIICAICERV